MSLLLELYQKKKTSQALCQGSDTFATLNRLPFRRAVVRLDYVKITNYYGAFMTRHYANSKKKLIYDRKLLLEQWLELKQNKVPDQTLQHIFHISRATFFRWQKLYNSQGVYGLKPKSTRPLHLRQPDVLTKDILAKIKQLRLQNPYFGKVKIHTRLLQQGYTLSLSSVGRALHHLMRRGLITPVVVLKCNKERKFIRKFTRSYSKRLPKYHKSPIELDHTIINLRGKQQRVFVAYDRASKFTLSKAYSHATSDNAADFLHFLTSRWPYTPTQLQVDGGSEFRGTFETACKIRNITLFVLPPRSPKLNGGVERYNQTLQDEFFLPNYNTLPTDTQELNKELAKWQIYYNEVRPHRSLIDKHGRLMSPCQFLKTKQFQMY